MAHKLRPDLFFILICLIFLFQSLYSSSAVASLDSPILPSSFHSLISASAASSSAQKLHSHACYPPDRDALLEVNTSIYFPARPMSQWRQEQDCCLWMGVTCGSGPFNSTTMSTSNSSATPKLYSRVVKLDLWAIPWRLVLADIDGKVISSGVLPLAICRLSALISLDLSNNALIGPIPTCFGHNLTSLQTLDLSANSLSGSLSPLANLSLLTHLDLAGNAFSGSIVSFTKGLSTNLRYLDLYSNQLQIPLTTATFNTTPLLQYLDLGGINDQITGDIRVLEHLQHLETLQLWGMSVPVPAPDLGSLFCKLGSLQSLTLTYHVDNKMAARTVSSVLSDKLLCEKPAPMNLTFLDLTGQGYTGPFPAWIAHFAGLQSLLLEGNQFEGSIPQEWQALTQLTELFISNDLPVSTPVSLSQEDRISSLFRLPLESLYLESMGLTSEDFPCASGFSLLNHTLQDLYLPYNHISPGHKSLLHCLQHHNFSHLSNLVLSNNPLAMPLQPHMFPVSIELLYLRYCELFGSLSSITTLPSAAVIDLSHNNLTGSIPSDIGSTLGAALVKLDLSYNKLTGIIPSSIWNLTSSRSIVTSALSLSNNHLHGEVDLRDQILVAQEVYIANNFLGKAYFHNVSYLRFLDLSNNQLGGTLEGMLGNYSMMKNLRGLLLHNNQLQGSIPTSLGTSAPFLITMDLSNNMLTGAIPLSLQHLQALQSKIAEKPTMHYLAFTYTLQSVKNVEFNMTYSRGHLDLSSNQLNGIIPDCLGALVGLHDLNLSRNHLSGSIPASLAHLASLEFLDLSFNILEGAIPPELSNLTSLEVFNVSFNPELSGKIPEGPQFETASSYEGDHKVCGQAIKKNCGDQQFIGTLTPTGEEPGSNTLQTLGFKERFASFIKWIEEWTTNPGIILGHVLGTAIVIWALKRIHFYE